MALSANLQVLNYRCHDPTDKLRSLRSRSHFRQQEKIRIELSQLVQWTNHLFYETLTDKSQPHTLPKPTVHLEDEHSFWVKWPIFRVSTRC